MVAAPPPSPPAIVRAWSAALNRNDNAAAAKLFAPNAQVIQGSLSALLATRQLATSFNASLPCAGRIIRITVKGAVATATFVLGHRPKHTCTASGQKAAAVFVVHGGKIAVWEQVPVPAAKSGGPPA